MRLRLGGLRIGRSTFLKASVYEQSLISLRRWSFGTNRLQLDADMKLLSEFLTFVKTDAARLAYHVTSLTPNQLPATHHCKAPTSVPVPCS